MRVGAAALVGLAVAVGLAGWYALGAIVLGLLFTHAAHHLRAPAPPAGWQQWLSSGVLVGTQTAYAALFAAVLADYLFAAAAALVAPLFILVVAVAEVAGTRVNTYYRRWFAGLTLAAVVVFLAISLTIPPVERPGLDAGSAPGGPGVLLAVAIATALFAGVATEYPGTKRGYLRFGAAAAALLAVAAAAMYQIGPVRFGLSPTSLRDVIVSAEAAPLIGLLAATVVLTTVPAGIDALRQARACLEPAAARWQARARYTLPCATVAAALAGVLGPVSCLLVATALVLSRVLLRALLVLRQRRNVPALLVAAAAVVLLVTVPPAELLIGVMVAAVAAAGVRLRAARAR